MVRLKKNFQFHNGAIYVSIHILVRMTSTIVEIKTICFLVVQIEAFTTENNAKVNINFKLQNKSYNLNIYSKFLIIFALSLETQFSKQLEKRCGKVGCPAPLFYINFSHSILIDFAIASDVQRLKIIPSYPSGSVAIKWAVFRQEISSFRIPSYKSA